MSSRKNISGLVDEQSFLEALSEVLLSIGCAREIQTTETAEAFKQADLIINISSEAISQVVSNVAICDAITAIGLVSQLVASQMQRQI